MNNSLKILIGVFILLLAGVLLFTRSLYDSPGGGLFKFNVKNASVLVIRGKGEVLVLKKKENVWRITNKGWAPAEESQVERALKSILDFSGQDVVSRNREKQAVYQVIPELGTTVLFSSGSSLETNNGFIVGKLSQDYMNSYVRKLGSSLTLKEKGFLQGQFPANPDSWVKHRVFNSSPDYIMTRVLMSNFSFTSNPSKLVLERKGLQDGWNISYPIHSETGHQAINGYLQDMKYLRLMDYLSETNHAFGRTGQFFKAPAGIMKLEYANGYRETLVIGSDPTNGHYYCEISGRKDVFMVDRTQLANLVKKVTDLTQGKGSRK